MNIYKRGAQRRLFVSKKDVVRSIGLLLLAVLLYTNLLRLTSLHVAAQSTPLYTPAPSSSVSHSEATALETAQSEETSIPAAVLSAIESKPPVTVPQECTVAAPYLTPSSLPLSDVSSPLTMVVDAPGYYKVYGSSIEELRAALQSCKYRVAAAGSYHAVTARQMNWSYGFSQTGDVCTLQDLRIGLHLAQLMPTFSPTATTPSNVTAVWNRYATNLATHENGHVAIATQYTNELVAKLQALQPMRCDLMRTQVAQTIANETALLNMADELYDAKTNHGATQGAVL